MGWEKCAYLKVDKILLLAQEPDKIVQLVQFEPYEVNLRVFAGLQHLSDNLPRHLEHTLTKLVVDFHNNRLVDTTARHES